jgi:hypothetical protein
MQHIENLLLRNYNFMKNLNIKHPMSISIVNNFNKYLFYGDGFLDQQLLVSNCCNPNFGLVIKVVAR